MTVLARTAVRLREVVGGRPVTVVMTMGALHAGHAELIHRARAHAPEAAVVVTDFVNPTQFGAGEDFDRYPRTLEADVALCEAAGADAVLAPTVDEVYPSGPVATIDAGPIGRELEGAVRPGHFDGMLTVVSRFMDLTGARAAAFGEKDYQQLVLVEAMAARRIPPVAILRVPTAREADGVAMSSRNRYLSAAERTAAASIPDALEAAAAAAPRGERAAIQAGLAALDPSLGIDYLVVRDGALGPARPGPGRILIAVRAGSTRLIDNVPCEVGP